MDFFEQLEKGRFGSFELKHQVGPNLLKGLLISCLIHGSVIASPLVYQLLRGKEVVVVSTKPPGQDTLVVIMPPLLPQNPEKWHPAFPAPRPEKPVVTIPTPVDVEPPPDSTKVVPSARNFRDYNRYVADSVNARGGGGNGSLTSIEFQDEPIVPIDTFIAVEVEPQALETNPQPAYPELARKAGLDGKVTVQFFVDRKGKVRQWQIVQVNPVGLGFDEEVLKVIPAWKFTPAIQSGKPIGVWVAVPFRFKVSR